MALRLLEMVVPGEQLPPLEHLLRETPLVEVWYDRISERQTLVKILAQAEETDHLLDELQQRWGKEPWFRLILLPVAASLPRVEQPPPETAPAPGEGADKPKQERISREELCGAVKDMAGLTRVYLGMVALSTVVAAAGLQGDNVVVIVGAMVIAPLLGPLLAQALAITLGDTELARLALRTNVTGSFLALALSMVAGLLLPVNPGVPELAARTRIGLGDMAVALASGGAGALAFTAGAPLVRVGVMVAVALLPPLTALGLLLGSGHLLPALGAALLWLPNMLCLILAGVMVFWLQGVRPTRWWEQERARRATRLAVALCTGLLLMLALAILGARKL